MLRLVQRVVISEPSAAMPSVVAPPVTAWLEEESCSGEDRKEARRESRESSSVKCEECGENEAKYQCPGCGVRSCCLPCVKSHKERTECDGKRKRTAFVRLSEYNDNLLISDYNFLEETLRLADSAKRLRAPLCGSSGGKTEVHPALKALQRQAKSRSTSLLFVAQGMSKRKANTSFFERKTKCIYWRVEWMFEGTGIQLIDERVDENSSLENVLAKHLNSESGDVMVRHRLRNFRRKHLDELKFLLPKESCPASEKGFHELNHKDSLRDHLVNKTIIEYPVITVVLPEDARKFVIAPMKKPSTNSTDNDQADGPITPTLHVPEGVLLREEEIEERIPEGIPFKEEEIEEIEEGEFVP